MAQGSFILRNVSGQRSNYPGVDSSRPSDEDDLQSAVGFPNGVTIKRLSLKRRPRAAAGVEKPEGGGVSSCRSAESLSSSSASNSSDDTRLLGMSSSTRGRPPLPPPHGSSSDPRPFRSERPAAAQTETKPQPAARSLTLPRQTQTSTETHKHLDQDVTSPLQPPTPPQPHPRRRLASFGGVSSPGSLSPFTGLGAYNHNNNGNKPTDGEPNLHLGSSVGTRGSTGCLGMSPQSSGRSTPVSGHVGPVHLQLVRDQMVVALQRLKELEEQVKTIPVLKVKISVLQEEKRQLVHQLRNQTGNQDVVWGSVEKTDTTEEELDHVTDILEFRQLTEEMAALERTIKGRRLQTWHEKDATSSPPVKESKHANTDPVETRSIATEVSEVHLGIYTEQDAELDAQQLIISALKEKIGQLEAELKESALRTEMSRLKLELQAAGTRNRADKASSARPSTVSTGVEAKPETASQGVGDHRELRDAGVGEATEVRSVGVSCGPELKGVCTGPDDPMSQWEVRRRVETAEKGVGRRVSTNTQGVGVEVEVRDAETNTETPVKKKVNPSVGCGDCSVDVIIYGAREVVSQGVATDQVRGVDFGAMATPKTTSQRTNTASGSVSRFTNTRRAFSADSSTNTSLCTQDKHTNTSHTVTRTVSVGGGVNDLKCVPETRTIGVGTLDLLGFAWKQTSGTVAKETRDTGVGFSSINENFLVGLKTRNMASGPSHLPDPVRTRSVGVGEGRIRDLTVSPCKSGPPVSDPQSSQWDPELNHYIEKMQWLLRDHGDLVSEDFTPQREVDGGLSGSAKLHCNNTTTEIHPLDPQAQVGRDFQCPSRLADESSKCEKPNEGLHQRSGGDSEVKRMIQMLEQQTSSALQDRSANAPRSGKKKPNGEQACSNNRKSMKLMRVTTGLDPVASYELTSGAKTNPEDVKRKGSKKLKEASQEETHPRKVKSGSKGSKGSAKSHAQQRCKLSKNMLSACQALKMHLSDDTALTSRELHDCLQTLQEWFSVSSHKSAAPDSVEDYLSTFRLISPAVLRHIANMADGNGNTALHYSVSHSNFSIVRKLLDAEVCNVDQQNKAGYTPIMLAALAAVDGPDDMRVVERLFTKGDVNAKASQAGQTALMLAVSHGRMDMVRALLAQGAQVNLQDDEGSTALMCASEHGHVDIVRLLLAQPDCDAALTDSDESTALSIALEAGHNDIAVLLYAHANFSKGQAGAAARQSGRSLSSPGGRSGSE